MSSDDKRDVIAQLRAEIAAVEATTTDMDHPPAVTAPELTGKETPKGRGERRAYPEISYPGMPEEDDWLTNLPPRIRHGEKGFDRRLMTELAEVGIRCYNLSELSNKVRTMPQAIPIFTDWLTHLEERIPGPETRHRRGIRAGLIRNLNDLAARGNSEAIDLLIEQLRRDPPLDNLLRDYAQNALGRIATTKDFHRIAVLLDELPEDAPRWRLIEYLGRVKTAEAREIAVRYVDTEYTIFAIKALIQMKASGVRELIEPYLTDRNSTVRKYAKRAMERLPE